MKLADIATTVHHHQQLPAEIVRHLRQNFKQPQQTSRIHSEDESKVRIRTDRYYKPEKGKDYWRMKYDRHEKQKKCGFYTPAHIPYDTMGDVRLDLKDLVLNALGKTDEKIVLKKDKYVKKHMAVRIQEKPEYLSKQEAKRKEKDTKATKDIRTDNKGGFLDIHNKLQVQNNRMVVLRAGQPYNGCLQKEAEVKAIKLLEEQQNQPEPCISPTRLRQILSKMRVTERTDSQCEGEVDVIDSMSREDSHEDILNQRDHRERNSRNLSRKFQCLQNLLVYIYQLRSRDLRTKNPLSKDFLKSLKKSVPTDQRGRIIRNPRTANQYSHSRGGCVNRSSTDALESRLEGDNFPLWSPHMQAQHSYFHESTSYLFRGGTADSHSDSRYSFFSRKLGKSEDKNALSLRLKDGTPKVEMSWDDFVEGKLGATGLTGVHGHEQAARGAPTRSSFANTVRNIFRRRRTGIVHHLPQSMAIAPPPVEHLAIWQQVAANEKNSKEQKSTGVSRLIHLRRRSRRTSKIRTLADIIGEDFSHIRFRSAEVVKDKLKQIETQEKKIFEHKFHALKPVFGMYEMDMNMVKQAGVKIYKDYEDDNVQAAAWYNELEKEAEILGVKNEVEIIELLNRFYPFAIDDVPTVPFIKAKLCLLIQSLPIYDLCSVAMQEAIQFLMMHILDCTPAALSEWMQHRTLTPLPCST